MFCHQKKKKSSPYYNVCFPLHSLAVHFIQNLVVGSVYYCNYSTVIPSSTEIKQIIYDRHQEIMKSEKIQVWLPELNTFYNKPSFNVKSLCYFFVASSIQQRLGC